MSNNSEIYYINKNYHASLDQDKKNILFVNGFNESFTFAYREMHPGAFQALEMVFEQKDTREILKSLPQHAKSEFQEVLDALIAKRVLEPSSEIDLKDKFSRQILYLKSIVGSYEKAVECQKRILNAKILVCGVGGVGSYVFNTLSAIGVGEIRFVDFDEVEESNITRQVLYKHPDIGRAKVDVALERGLLTSPDTNFIKYNKRIHTLDDLDEMADGVDLIINSMDNPRPYTQFLINEYALTKKIAFCQSGTNSDLVFVGPFVVPGKSLCHRCTWNTWHVKIEDEPDLIKAVRDNFGTAVIDPINMMAASFLTNMAVQYISGTTGSVMCTNKGYVISLRDPLQMHEVLNNGFRCETCEALEA